MARGAPHAAEAAEGEPAAVRRTGDPERWYQVQAAQLGRLLIARVVRSSSRASLLPLTGRGGGTMPGRDRDTEHSRGGAGGGRAARLERECLP